MPPDSLRADCSNCLALCCVALPFTESGDFAIEKAGGVACPNLQSDDRCGIHARLREQGFAGCTTFDCYGAGQQVSQHTFAGQHWRTGPAVAEPMFAAFAVMRQLHEMRWHLRQAGVLDDSVRVLALSARLARAADQPVQLLLELDVAALRVAVGAELARVSRTVRSASGRELRGADLLGVDLRDTGRRGGEVFDADLRGAYLIGADLRDVDLGRADLLGADLRDARIAGADLGSALFVTQAQLDGARGDGRTVLPVELRRPLHWLG